MTVAEAKKEISNAIIHLYEQREITAITTLLLEKITGLTRLDQIIQKRYIDCGIKLSNPRASHRKANKRNTHSICSWGSLVLWFLIFRNGKYTHTPAGNGRISSMGYRRF